MLNGTATNSRKGSKSGRVLGSRPSNDNLDCNDDGLKIGAAQFVANLLRRGDEGLRVTVEVGGQEYRVIVERRRNAPVLHDRW
jgi:hypothetical protein